MLESDYLKIAAAICSVVGSGLLAWRVRGILDALSLVANAHEANIQQLMPNYHSDIINLGNATAHIEKAKGTRMLVSGFLLLLFSGVLNFVSLMF